jgi:hypothetical protein
MSPDRGERPSVARIHRDSSSIATDRADSGYGESIMEDDLNKVTGSPIANLSNDENVSDVHPDSTSRQRRSQHESASMKSASSAPSSKSSRRDSAVSASSQPRQRKKISRSTSHQVVGTSLHHTASRTSSVAPRPHPRRMTSSPHIQGRGVTNIEEALALHQLHQRSCQIFGAPTRPTTSHGALTALPDRPKILDRRATAVDAPMRRDLIVPAGPIRSRSGSDGVSSHDFTSDEPRYENYVPATIIDWTSTETRRQEYYKIDRSNKGVRGLLKKLFPKLATRSSESRFYDEKEGSTSGSVRRFRMDLPDEEDEGSKSK